MDNQKNIIFILTDQQRLSAVGCYGNTPCQTPHINALTQEGIRFERAYTACPLCSPSRASIITGKYPHSHGITTNIHEMGCNVSELADHPQLLSRRLQKVGYNIGFNGKWHLGTDLDRDPITHLPNKPSLPKNVGFDGWNYPGHGGGGHHYPEYQEYLHQNNWVHQVKPWSEKTRPIFSAGELVGPLESTMAYFLVDQTISLIDKFRKEDKPFFLWHNFWGPHIPYYVTAEWLDYYRSIEIPPWPNYHWPSRQISGPHQMKIHPHYELLTWDDWATIIRYYYAYASMIDGQIGRLIGYLKRMGLYDNTIIIFAADHGETLGSHGGLYDKGWHHFEETHHIPFVIRVPKTNPAIKRELVSLLDLYPTILDYAGGQIDSNLIHGRSLRPILENNEHSDWRKSIVTEFHGLGNACFAQRTIVNNDGIKYGYNLCCDDELYDLNKDPWETRNVIRHPEYKGILHDLRENLSNWMEETNDSLRRMYHLSRWHEERSWHRHFKGIPLNFGGDIKLREK
jgi:arylsulfatase A-like enzyme